MTRLAIVTTHPIQYYAPWFRQLAQAQPLQALKVFYLWDFGITRSHDPQFGREIRWDIPLLDGYDWELVPNRSHRPGTDHPGGIWNPELPQRLLDWQAEAVLMMTYNYASGYRLLTSRRLAHLPFLFRGDSHCFDLEQGLPLPLTERLRQLWLRQVVYRRMQAVLYVGQANRRYFRRYGVPEERLFFSPHCIDLDRFAAQADPNRAQALRHSWGIAPGQTLVLFCGKFVARKRPLDLVAAIAPLPDPDLRLVFVGDGPLEAELQQAAARDPRIQVHPFRNQSQMPITLSAADLLVLPSDRGETWGLIVNEAMACGTPALVSDRCGCHEDLIVPGVTGDRFQAGDVDSLRRALTEALRDPAQLHRWGATAAQYIRRYSYEGATAGLLEALAFLELEREAIA